MSWLYLAGTGIYDSIRGSGLSGSDIERLEAVLNELVDGKNTIVIIEHNIEFIAAISDYLIDQGSVAGNKGGSSFIQGDRGSCI